MDTYINKLNQSKQRFHVTVGTLENTLHAVTIYWDYLEHNSSLIWLASRRSNLPTPAVGIRLTRRVQGGASHRPRQQTGQLRLRPIRAERTHAPGNRRSGLIRRSTGGDPTGTAAGRPHSACAAALHRRSQPLPTLHARKNTGFRQEKGIRTEAVRRCAVIFARCLFRGRVADGEMLAKQCDRCVCVCGSQKRGALTMWERFSVVVGRLSSSTAAMFAPCALWSRGRQQRSFRLSGRLIKYRNAHTDFIY